MLLELSVENLAIFDRASVSPGPGLTVLTGETGAGKSLLVDALELVLGERSDATLVRAGAARAAVHAAFDLSARPDLAARLAEWGVDLEGGVLYVQREVAAEGRSQCRMGGRLAPVSLLKQVGALLVDLHGQHEHQSLLYPERHVEFLDDWAGAPTLSAREAVRVVHADLAQVRSHLAELRAGLRDRERRMELLRFQVDEIDGAALRIGEEAELAQRLAVLKSAGRLRDAGAQALDSLRDREGSALDQLASVFRLLGDLSRIDPGLEPIVAALEGATVGAAEATRELATYLDRLDADPALLDVLVERADTLRRLIRKYGDNEADVLAVADAARAEVEVLEQGEAGLHALENREAALAEQLRGACAALSALRWEAARGFASQVTSELADLAMGAGRFEVAIEPVESGATGADRVEFFFCANAGEPLRPLARTASGGEVSRLMLAMKCAANRASGAPTLVFDEVDSGLGGQAAQVVANKLEKLSALYQVLVISHLPQIAGRAAQHLRVQKGEQGGRTVATVDRLDGPARVEEVARLLSGSSTETALAHAQELLSRP